jgi:hypothetical protein
VHCDDFVSSVRARGGRPRDETRDAVEPGEFDDVLTQLGGESARLVPGSR